MPEAEVVTVMERELGVPWEDAFGWIDPKPLAAGTIGQVHRARLADGSPVVVKVQRPTAAELIERDLAVLATLAGAAGRSTRVRNLIDIVGLVDQLSASLRTELDFTREANHLDRMADVLSRYELIDVPKCHRSMSTARLLVMDEVQGVCVEDAERSAELTEAARELLASFFHQVLGAGFFHADPHPGNLMWGDGKLWLIDLGMVGELEPATRQQLMMLLLAFWQGDGQFLADLLINLGGGAKSSSRPVDMAGLGAALAELSADVRAASLSDLEIGPLLEQMTQIALKFHIELPAGLALVAKAMTQVQLTVTQLVPDQDLFAEARKLYLRDTVSRVTQRADPTKWIYEMEKLRRGLDTVMEAASLAVGARPGKRLQIGFSSEQIERSITRAGRAIAGGVAGGMAILGAAIAYSSRRRQ
jgi:predicted unusual protein kinase regulating ubiquinone biosynthesis (AarF/ABC1/UbiB family)